jgi:outer membrane protein OmpA-like peptidoglycan-associated protein
MRTTLAIAAMLGICGLPLLAAAQSNPSSQQIIEALRPSGDLLGGPTRGIRPVNPPAAATPQPAQPAAASAAAAAPRVTTPGATQPAAARTAAPAAAPSVNLSVTFATGSAELTPQAIRILDELGRALSSPDLAGFRFRVEGHTDTVGASELNQTLSDRRAAAVVDYLTTRFAIPAARLQPIGMGETQPLVPTGDQTPEPRNRRVQVINIGT